MLELVDIPTREEFLVATSTAIARAFVADVAFWDECAIRDQTWSVMDVECAQAPRAIVARILTDVGRDHPGVASYLLDPQIWPPAVSARPSPESGTGIPGRSPRTNSSESTTG